MRNIPNKIEANSLIVDSGVWLALGDVSDRYHLAALAALERWHHLVLVVTWPVITESSYLLYKRAGYQARMDFLQFVQRGGVDVFHLDGEATWLRMNQLMEKYRDLPMDLADASLVMLAEELGHGRILSTDQRDFNAYRWKNREPFENLLVDGSLRSGT